MVDFLLSVIPCQYKTSQELVSHDIQSNVYNYKYTYFVEVLHGQEREGDRNVEKKSADSERE